MVQGLRLRPEREPVDRRQGADRRTLLGEIEPGWALDLASGTGRLSKILREFGHDVAAVDGSLEMLGRAREGRSPEALIRGDLQALPLRDESFDVIVCGLSLTHTEHLIRPVAEIARVIRPGGTVVITDIHPLAVATGAHAFFEREGDASAVIRNHVHWLSEYAKAFRASGLRIDRILEPPYDRTLLERVEDEELRSALEIGVVGLPFVLIWVVGRQADASPT